MKRGQSGEALATIFGFLFGVALFGAWITHLVVCFQQNRWGFLIAGAIFFPVAIVHGVGVWFGAW